jgi:hypothetical protein
MKAAVTAQAGSMSVLPFDRRRHRNVGLPALIYVKAVTLRKPTICIAGRPTASDGMASICNGKIRRRSCGNFGLLQS